MSKHIPFKLIFVGGKVVYDGVDDMTMRPPDVEGEVLCGWQVGVRERQRLCRSNRGP